MKYFHVSLNIAILAIFYTVLGGVLSYIIHIFFDDHDELWEKKSILFKFFDVAVELILIGIVAFWLVFHIRDAPPIFAVSKSLDELTDTYISGVFFSFSLFLFFEDLGSKIKYLYKQIVDPVVKKYVPTKGSILDLSLKFVKI
jgi:hypothetical protein